MRQEYLKARMWALRQAQATLRGLLAAEGYRFDTVLRLQAIPAEIAELERLLTCNDIPHTPYRRVG